MRVSIFSSKYNSYSDMTLSEREKHHVSECFHYSFICITSFSKRCAQKTSPFLSPSTLSPTSSTVSLSFLYNHHHGSPSLITNITYHHHSLKHPSVHQPPNRYYPLHHHHHNTLTLYKKKITDKRKIKGK